MKRVQFIGSSCVGFCIFPPLIKKSFWKINFPGNLDSTQWMGMGVTKLSKISPQKYSNQNSASLLHKINNRDSTFLVQQKKFLKLIYFKKLIYKSSKVWNCFYFHLFIYSEELGVSCNSSVGPEEILDALGRIYLKYIYVKWLQLCHHKYYNTHRNRQANTITQTQTDKHIL